MNYARYGVAFDSETKKTWITMNGTHVPVEGNRLGGEVGRKIEKQSTEAQTRARQNIRPEDLTTFEQFLDKNAKELGKASWTKKAKAYIERLIEETGKKSVYCNGMYRNEQIIAVNTGSSKDEIASKLTSSSVRALRYMFDVMETGTLIGIAEAPKEKHKKKNIESFGYFQKTVDMDGATTLVQVDVALMTPRTKPKARPYVVSIKKEGSELTYPLRKGGHSSKPSHGEDASLADLLRMQGCSEVSSRSTNIVQDAEPIKAFPVRVSVLS